VRCLDGSGIGGSVVAESRRRCACLSHAQSRGQVKFMRVRILLAFACFLALGCESHDTEKNFFKQPLANRVERLRQYSLVDQYKIFRYGNDMREPPFMDLAIPIAERGATVCCLRNAMPVRRCISH
jgi:hypothetical protein